jgi:hypothetical protein
MLTVIWKRKIIKILTDHRYHQSSSKTFQRPEANQITNIQHTSNITVLCGSETRTLNEQDKSRITAADVISEKKQNKHNLVKKKKGKKVLWKNSKYNQFWKK